MATKKAAKKAPKAASQTRATPLDTVIDAGLEEAAAVGWRNVTMSAVAARAALSLGAVLALVPTRAHLVSAFLKRTDERTLARVKAVDEADSPRDRLFEATMRRFDVLNENRIGVRAMLKGIPFDPPAVAAMACRIDRAMAVLLGAAGISADGLVGLARIQGLKLIHVFVIRAWMRDDSEDLAKTMAALDRALGRAERFANLSAFRRRAPEAAATP
jgi:ubiquinone biosynthesis protein COQ9